MDCPRQGFPGGAGRSSAGNSRRGIGLLFRFRAVFLRRISECRHCSRGLRTRQRRATEAEYNMLGTAYLRTIGIPLMRGREFTRADNDSSPLVAVVNEKMATQ